MTAFDRELVAARLAEQEALFTLLGRAIYGMPDREIFAAMAERGIFDEVPFVDAEKAEPARKALEAWAQSCADPFGDGDFEAIRVDYARLFVGAQKVAAPLWESVYFNRERMVFQQQTMEVRRAYRTYGLEVDGFGHEPDDNLAFELLFMARLANLASGALVTENTELLKQVATDMKAFVCDHPLTWVDAWRDLVVEKAQGGFYPGYAMLVVLACSESARFAQSLLEQME